VPQIVLDDVDATYDPNLVEHCSVGSGSIGNGFIHDAGRMSDSTDNDVFVSYEINVEESGCYAVEEYHPVVNNLSAACGSFSATTVPVQINYCKGQVAWKSVDQAVNGGQWNQIARVPFYSGHVGSIKLTRGDDSAIETHTCPGGSCFWMADAFRVRRLAETCHDAEVADGVQLTLDTPVLRGDASLFAFMPPLDGCYMIEEHHPQNFDTKAAALKVDFCKGERAFGNLDYSDGRHSQWNYLGSFPFFEQHEGRFFVPQRQLQDGQKFRLSRGISPLPCRGCTGGESNSGSRQNTI